MNGANTRSGSSIEPRAYQVPGFVNWKAHDAFEAAFAGSLKDLKSNSEATAA
jgi:hypothetical protein